MINVAELFNILKQNDVECYCGVPDSLLKDFCAYITDNVDEKHHTITANEGNAIALAVGHYLATGNIGCVYMQNSGIGNCINPLLSLVDEEVYNIPVFMLIGWRGEPGKKDEPQHIKQGKVTDKLLDSMGIKYCVLPGDIAEAKQMIDEAFIYMRETNRPYAFIIKKGIFEKYSLKNKKISSYTMSREYAIETIIKSLSICDVVVSTTGHISRELYEIRERLGQSHKQDFLTVGSMGHSSSIALGIALEKLNRNIYCFDGDGACLMHQGALTVNATKELVNFKHIVFNNEAHDSVGAQPTAVYKSSLAQVALDCGYQKSYSVSTETELLRVLPEFISNKCMSFLEIKVKCGARENLGRPKEKPQENKRIFMENLEQVEFVYRGSVENLSEILKIEDIKSALVFTGKKSYQKFKQIIEKELAGINIVYYNDFETNPKEADIKRAINTIDKNFDIILAVGGGSVIDFAKAYRVYTKSKQKLIAIPTTAGTGSESTQFAVIYIDGVKHSLDDKSILPDYAIVDSNFLNNSPKYIKACTAMDTFCHAIESYWALRSTTISREYAKRAILLCKDNLVKFVNTEDINAANNMALASNLAGKAINISRTTAAHAMSYVLTKEYGFPHGYAVSLFIAKLMELNLHVNTQNCNDKRGCDFVLCRVKEIYDLLGINNAKKYFVELFDNIHLKKTNFIDIDKDFVVKAVNLNRLSNNPVKLTQADLMKILENM